MNKDTASWMLEGPSWLKYAVELQLMDKEPDMKEVLSDNSICGIVGGLKDSLGLKALKTGMHSYKGNFIGDIKKMQGTKIFPARQMHLSFLEEHDKHVSRETLIRKIEDNEILIMELNGISIGWLRYGFFWDEIPFMNMLYFLDDYRRKGYGTLMIRYWENILTKKGYTRFLTSTMANEEAQHFYRKMGYTDIGGFTLPSEPLEILLMKDKAENPA